MKMVILYLILILIDNCMILTVFTSGYEKLEINYWGLKIQTQLLTDSWLSKNNFIALRNTENLFSIKISRWEIFAVKISHSRIFAFKILRSNSFFVKTCPAKNSSVRCHNREPSLLISITDCFAPWVRFRYTMTHKSWAQLDVLWTHLYVFHPTCHADHFKPFLDQFFSNSSSYPRTGSSHHGNTTCPPLHCLTMSGNTCRRVLAYKHCPKFSARMSYLVCSR